MWLNTGLSWKNKIRTTPVLVFPKQVQSSLKRVFCSVQPQYRKLISNQAEMVCFFVRQTTVSPPSPLSRHRSAGRPAFPICFCPSGLPRGRPSGTRPGRDPGKCTAYARSNLDWFPQEQTSERAEQQCVTHATPTSTRLFQEGGSTALLPFHGLFHQDKS